MKSAKRRVYQTVGGHLMRFRRENRYTQQQIADELNVSQSTYNRFETGEVPINIYYLTCLAEIYNKSINDFFGEYSGIYADVLTLRKEYAYLKMRYSLLEEAHRHIIEQGVSKDAFFPTR